MDRLNLLSCAAILGCVLSNRSVAQTSRDNSLHAHALVFGVIAGGGTAVRYTTALGTARAPVTLAFANAGVRLSKVVSSPHGRRSLRNQLEIASELLPFWQGIYPKQKLVYHFPSGTTTSPYFGYTTNGVSLTPVQLRLDFLKHPVIMPWIQIACGVLFTTRDFPANRTASVNFTPQAGLGLHVFTSKRQSLDFAANAVHISNGGTGVDNPGVPITFQASLGYSWWFHRPK